MLQKPHVSSGTVGELADSCVAFYKANRGIMQSDTVRGKRAQLSEFVEGFHRQCGTLTPYVVEKIRTLKEDDCVVLMTAHQPNLFAYAGVLRKATLNFVLARKLEEMLKVPVVNFFGIADQDFTDERWVKSAILPDVERRDGVLEIRHELPNRMVLNSVAKPSRQALASWRKEIENWLSRKLNSLGHFFKSFRLDVYVDDNALRQNFEDFWGIVEEAYARARSFSDFNGFVMSRVVNQAWGYDTLFCRFSECEQIFERELCSLLSRFGEYSRYVKEAIELSAGVQRGVYEDEFDTVPFWYHCDCGSKARLLAERRGQSLFGHGKCLHCGKEHEIDLGSKEEPDISEILPRISARSLPMPLIFFEGLRVCCYVGGVGGSEYLRQAKYVAEHMGMTFPPVVIWRPKDVYCGVGQLEALLTFRNLSGTFDFSRYQDVKRGLEDKIARVKKSVEELELYRKDLANSVESKSEETIQKVKAASIKQNEIRREAKFSLLTRNLKLLENAVAVTDLHPCIVDYAVNVGLSETSNQWVAFLNTNGNLSENLTLKTDLALPQNLALDLKNSKKQSIIARVNCQ
jgi:hypothetical protein